ncbi:MAG TPA: hypothetical protein VET26_10235, partial [Candidatus Sulfotelmatobacter sp.]|nr:hypothetical protein [Candidatus Sulfotelmatobacter sp.]
MAADDAKDHGQVRRPDLAEAGKTLEQFAALRDTERPNANPVEVDLGTGNGIAAGDQQPAASSARCQQPEVALRIGIAERVATRRQVLLEVVEHEHDRLLGQFLRQKLEADAIVEIGPDEELAALFPGLVAGLQQLDAQRQRDPAEVESSDVRGDEVAILGQALHGPAGQGALSHSTDSGEHDAGVDSRRIAQSAQSPAQLLSPPDQVVDEQLRHRPAHVVDGTIEERLPVGREI